MPANLIKHNLLSSICRNRLQNPARRFIVFITLIKRSNTLFRSIRRYPHKLQRLGIIPAGMIRKILKSNRSVAYILVYPFLSGTLFIKHSRWIALPEEIRNLADRMLIAVVLYEFQQFLLRLKLRHLNTPAALGNGFGVSMTVDETGQDKPALHVFHLSYIVFIGLTFLQCSHT